MGGEREDEICMMKARKERGHGHAKQPLKRAKCRMYSRGSKGQGGTGSKEGAK